MRWILGPRCARANLIRRRGRHVIDVSMAWPAAVPVATTIDHYDVIANHNGTDLAAFQVAQSNTADTTGYSVLLSAEIPTLTLAPSDTFYFRVRGSNADGSVVGNYVKSNVLSVPPAPTPSIGPVSIATAAFV